MLTVTMVEPVLVLSLLLAFGSCVMFDWGIQHVCINDNSPLATLYRLSFISCAHKCICLPGCEYVNYNHMLNSCQIYTTPVDVSNRTCYNAILLTKEDAQALVPQTIRRACAENETKYCSDSELESANADIHGNVNTIGAKRLKVCRPNYQMQGASRGTTVCTEDNGTAKWSALGVCESTVVKCDKPSVTDTIDVMSDIVVTSNGTVVNYTRLNHVTEPLLENSTISMRCSLNGTEYGKDMITCVSGSWTNAKPCAGALRQPCGNNETCNSAVPGSECRDGQCWCETGLSFNPSTSTCVGVCPGEYGTTFQIVRGTKILPVNIKEYTENDGNSVGKCMQRCLTRLDIVCTHANVDDNGYLTTCKICQINDTSIETTNIYSVRYTVLQRDCA